MKVAAYCRYSSDNQREESIDAQLRAITDWAQKHGHTIVATYLDEAKSATNDDRPRFLDMVKDAVHRSFQAAVVHKLDRFARNRYDAAFYRRELRNHGVQLISVQEPLDDSPESVILESVLEGMAEYFSKNLAREVRKGQHENALKCRHNGGIPPLGYSVNPDKTYAVNEHEAAAVRMIFDMAAAGHSHADTIRSLHNLGFTSKSGKAFTRNSIHDILKNEKYTGTFVYNRSAAKDLDGKRRHRQSKDSSEIIRIEGGIPRIISDETFRAVQARMADRKQGGRARSTRTYLLSGIVYCGICGAPMIGSKINSTRGKPSYAYYSCSSRKHLKPCGNRNVDAAFLEDLVLSRIRNEIANPERAGEIMDEIEVQFNWRSQTSAQAIEASKMNITTIEAQINNITQAVANGMFHQSLIDKLTALEAQREDAVAALAKLSAEPVYAPDMDQIRALLSSEALTTAETPEDLRRAIRAYVTRVVVHPGEIDVDTVLSVAGSVLSPPASDKTFRLTRTYMRPQK
ncbi:recombinase family protein [bacterium]|nr:MAG: recombinase family protein [bacterium]